jgi:Icc-related predicted phosphoesterase
MHLDWYASGFRQTGLSTTPFVDPFWYPKVLPDENNTTLILAGDIWTGTKFINYMEYSWISKVASRFKQVLVVLGNHDYWPGNDALTIKDGGKHANELLNNMGVLNVKVLDCDIHQDDDVLYVGATLWTDMSNSDPIKMVSMETVMSHDGKIAYETEPNGKWIRFTSQKWIDTHYRHLDYIKHVARENRNKKVVVITHHAPLTNLVDSSYANDFLNSYFSNDLGDFILDNQNIVNWCYGHTHHFIDKQLEHCRIMSNPVGYKSENRELKGLIQHSTHDVGQMSSQLIY